VKEYGEKRRREPRRRAAHNGVPAPSSAPASTPETPD
jgi:hypothetical protein